MTAWSERFNAYMKREGLTQLAIAHALNVAPSRVHGWCRGALPREDMQRKIAKWSGGRVPVHKPKGGTPSKPPPSRTGTDG